MNISAISKHPEAFHEGPFGNPDTTISIPACINLMKNDRIEEAQKISLEITGGRSLFHAAKNSNDLISYGIGSMIAKLRTKHGEDWSREAFYCLSRSFPQSGFQGNNAVRFNRRTVHETLVAQGLLAKNAPIRDAKPAGTLPTVSEIASIVDEYKKICLGQIQSPARSRKVVEARFIVIWAMRTVCGHSLTYIGEQLGGRDHTSILNGVSRMNQIRSADIAKRHQIDNICDEADLLALRRHYAILVGHSGLRRVS
ncbi:helix-turn-helix domain-containing protein [Pseudosulfitobacter pseudonitzschiae]|uniref:helix-turn-helix domain-containing protein n=1 Tax=Pseudosulfitobacter pseudonitzschiae TaxID=1402135 RepID=UPI003B80EB50